MITPIWTCWPSSLYPWGIHIARVDRQNDPPPKKANERTDIGVEFRSLGTVGNERST